MASKRKQTYEIVEERLDKEHAIEAEHLAQAGPRHISDSLPERWTDEPLEQPKGKAHPTFGERKRWQNVHNPPEDAPQWVWAKTQAKRERLETILREGATITDALRLADMSQSSYYKMRGRYREWRDRWDAAKAFGRTTRLTAIYEERDIPEIQLNFAGFVERFFPDRHAPQPHQVMLQEVLSRTAPREVVLFLLWPGSGKTSTVEDHICRTLAVDPEHRFRVVSSNDTHSGRMLDFCKRRFTDAATYPEYIARYGPFYEKNQERNGRPWSAEAITVYKSSGTERDRSIAATGWRAATLGARIDTLIWDDVQTPENLTQAETIFSRLRDTYFSRGKGIRTIIIGNRCGAGDLYERMLDEGLITDIVEVPACGALGADQNAPSVPDWWYDETNVHKKNGPCCGGRSPFRNCPADGKPLTPQEVVDQIKYQVGKQAWYSLWMQDPIANELSTFGAGLEGCFDYGRRVGQLAR